MQNSFFARKQYLQINRRLGFSTLYKPVLASELCLGFQNKKVENRKERKASKWYTNKEISTLAKTKGGIEKKEKK